MGDIIIQFIQEIQRTANLKVSELNIHLNKSEFKGKYPRYIIHNYANIEDYKYEVEEISKDLDFETQVIETQDLPHYRFFKFESGSFSFEIRIDAGIAHGLKPRGFLESENMPLENINFEIRKDVLHDLIYTLSITNNQD